VTPQTFETIYNKISSPFNKGGIQALAAGSIAYYPQSGLTISSVMSLIFPYLDILLGKVIM
jgi:hypothetical protein